MNKLLEKFKKRSRESRQVTQKIETLVIRKFYIIIKIDEKNEIFLPDGMLLSETIAESPDTITEIEDGIIELSYGNNKGWMFFHKREYYLTDIVYASFSNYGNTNFGKGYKLNTNVKGKFDFLIIEYTGSARKQTLLIKNCNRAYGTKVGGKKNYIFQHNNEYTIIIFNQYSLEYTNFKIPRDVIQENIPPVFDIIRDTSYNLDVIVGVSYLNHYYDAEYGTELEFPENRKYTVIKRILNNTSLICEKRLDYMLLSDEAKNKYLYDLSEENIIVEKADNILNKYEIFFEVEKGDDKYIYFLDKLIFSTNINSKISYSNDGASIIIDEIPQVSTIFIMDKSEMHFILNDKLYLFGELISDSFIGTDYSLNSDYEIKAYKCESYTYLVNKYNTIFYLLTIDFDKIKKSLKDINVKVNILNERPKEADMIHFFRRNGIFDICKYNYDSFVLKCENIEIIFRKEFIIIEFIPFLSDICINLEDVFYKEKDSLKDFISEWYKNEIAGILDIKYQIALSIIKKDLNLAD